MEFTVVVLYRKALAHYTVAVRDEGIFEANLLKYGGSSHDLPPPKIWFKKEGRHCSGNTDEQDLMDDLYVALQEEMENAGNSSSPDLDPEAPYVSI